MNTSSLPVPASLLLVIGLGVIGCGQAVGHDTESPPSDGGAAPTLDSPTPPSDSAQKPPRKVEATPPADAGAGGAAGPENDEGGAPSAAPVVATTDTVPPRIVALQPRNAALGVEADARIVIEFNEPMDQRATAAAFVSDSLTPAQTVMSWNDAGTVLTVTPKVALDYAHATLTGADPLELAAKTYAYTLQHSATDLAGNPLPETTVSFSTLREVTHTLTPVTDLTGVLSDISGNFGFITFDVGTLPAGISELKSAVARTRMYRVAAPIAIDDVEFAQLSPAAITAGPGALVATLPRGLSGDQMIPASMSAFMASDYEHRSPAYHYSQFRLDLSAYTAPSDLNQAAQLLANSSIEADYLVP